MLFYIPTDWISLKRIKWWLLFAGVFSLLYCWGVTRGILTHKPISTLDFIQVVVNGIGAIAIWGLGLRKRVLWQKLWRLIFGFDLLILFLTWIFPGSTKQERHIISEIYIVLVLALPYYSGMFIYAFRSRAIWHPGEVNPSNNLPEREWRLTNSQKERIKNILVKIQSLLRDGHETHQAELIQHALDGTEEEFSGFLISDDLWGGPGSVADQALIGDKKARRELENLMFQLGRIQVKKNIVNARTKMWTIAFKERRNMSF
jgi:hypothetical protein